MTHLWKQYQAEKYNRKTITYRGKNGDETGCIMYNIFDDGSCLIDVLFVEAKSRNKGFGKRLEQTLIRREKPRSIYCEVDSTSNNWEETLAIFESHGYTKSGLSDRGYVLCKHLY